MISLPPTASVFAIVPPVDGRKSIDGLAAQVRFALDRDPMSGDIFLFRNRSKTTVKLLSYDGQGYWLAMKRLSEGKFRHWPTQCGISPAEAALLLWALDIENVKPISYWRPITE